jgi:hypothetical protein
MSVGQWAEALDTAARCVRRIGCGNHALGINVLGAMFFESHAFESNFQRVF